jgi:DNA repair exonuclease SbcCD nuclease subunit
MTKIALISDIHFGCRNNSEQYLEMIRKFFTETLYKVLIDKKITDVRILGDLFDCRNNINVRTLNVVLETFEWYEKTAPDIVFTIFPGNHDVYYRNKNDVSSMKALAKHSNIVLHSRIHSEILGDKKVLSVPWLVDDAEDTMKFAKICDGDEHYDLLLGHFEIRGFEINKGQFDETGKDEGTFKNFTRVFSGHYHIRNTINQISYLGCPYELTWGDYDDAKGIHIYDLDTGITEFIQNNDSPKHIKVSINDIKTSNKDILKKIRGNYVKLIVNEKVDDTWLVKAQAKIEGMETLRLDIENTVIDELDTKEGMTLTNSDNPLSFLYEYVENIELSDKPEIDKNELKKYLSDIYGASLT